MHLPVPPFAAAARPGLRFAAVFCVLGSAVWAGQDQPPPAKTPVLFVGADLAFERNQQAAVPVKLADVTEL